MRRYSTILALVLLTLLHPGACAQKRFPEWKVSPIGLEGSWEMAPIVVVADVRNVAPIGVQKIKNPPWPVASTIDRVYWCQGDFVTYAVVKGRRPASGKKFVWGSVHPGCELNLAEPPRDGRPFTDVWFIREEGNYLRPVVDGGGYYCYTFYTNWDDGSSVAPQTRFARLLLTPSADGASVQDYARRFFTPASTACFILGREPCIEQIRALAALGDPDLRQAACEFLRSQFQEKCAP